jgi:hypothetical protein
MDRGRAGSLPRGIEGGRRHEHALMVGTTILPDRRLSMDLMAQPGVAGDWLPDPRLTDQGLTFRVLVTAPDSTAGTRFWQEWKGNGDLAAYDRRIFDLAGRPLLIDQAGGGVRPRVLSMSAAARQAWSDFYNWWRPTAELAACEDGGASAAFAHPWGG